MLASKTEGTDVTEYYYDLMGNLKGVDLPDGTTIEYLVDGFGRRTWKKVDGVLEKGWIYKDALNPVAELDGSGNVVSYFVYGSKAHVPDYMLKLESGSWVKYRFVTDQIGSVRYVINESDSTVAQEMVYSPFGEALEDSLPGFQPFGFAGGLYDGDTGLVRFGRRDYSAETGRWQSKDPILFGGGDTNLYGYVMGDPVNLIDPDGLFFGPVGSKYWWRPSKPENENRNGKNRVPSTPPDQNGTNFHFFGWDEDGRFWMNNRVDNAYRFLDGSEGVYKDGEYACGSYNYSSIDPLAHTLWDYLPYKENPYLTPGLSTIYEYGVCQQ